LLCQGICSIELRKKKFTDRQSAFNTVQYSTLRGLEVVHTAVCCSLSTLPFRNAQFHLTETSVSADTDLAYGWRPLYSVAYRPPRSLHAHKQQPFYVQRNIEERSCDHCYLGKAITITYSECESVALVIQHAKRMRRIIASSDLASLAYFLTLIS
jgi:hypothetical protein